MSNSIVEKLISTANYREVFSIAREVLADNKAKIGKSGRLKSRTIRLDTGELGEFINEDFTQVALNYHKDISSRLALKEILDIDANKDINKFARENGIVGKDKHDLADAVKSAQERSMLDPDSTSALSKTLRAVKKVNFLNFGGWFGVNALMDISLQVNNYGVARTFKYIAKDLVGHIQGNDPITKKGARILGNAAHSVINDRAELAINYSGEALSGAIDKGLSKASVGFSKYTGLNMVVDTLERTSNLAALDMI